METEEKGNPLPAILLVVAVLSVGTACFVGAGVWEPAKNAVATPKTVAPVPAVPSFRLGEIVAIRTSCIALTLAVTPQAAATEERLTIANDREGIRELIQADLIYCAKAEGHVRIIGFDADPEATRKLGFPQTWIQVRLIDGEAQGRAGWVNAACLKRH